MRTGLKENLDTIVGIIGIIVLASMKALLGDCFDTLVWYEGIAAVCGITLLTVVSALAIIRPKAFHNNEDAEWKDDALIGIVKLFVSILFLFTLGVVFSIISYILIEVFKKKFTPEEELTETEDNAEVEIEA